MGKKEGRMGGGGVYKKEGMMGEGGYTNLSAPT